MVPHFLVDPDAVHGDSVALGPEEAWHLVGVLRARPGDRVTVADGTGAVYTTRIARVQQDAVTLAVVAVEHVTAIRPRLTVVHALPKGRKLDDVVQRLTELDVDRLIPVRSARTEMELTPEKADKVVARWRAVALAAAKQSRRVRPLEIAPVSTWTAAFAEGLPGVICWEEAVSPLREHLEGLLDADAVVLGIGPEGGLTREEVEATGLPACSLGPTILRTQTAALVAATALLTLLGRIG